jgi:4-amino-4-deoxy-L-arabinose transferase-like glycosyltransferase
MSSDPVPSSRASAGSSAPHPAETEPSARSVALWLLGLVILGTALRFVGLGAGLRHTPHLDERNFVEAVAQMLAAGDLDHRFYQYPGFFFYVLSPVLALVGAAHTQADALAFPAQAAPAYLAGRAVAAFFGVLQIPLTFWLGARVASRFAGLVAAALIAVAPIAVRTAHDVRPDTLLSVVALLALLSFQRLGRDSRGDLLAGALVGVACATKFTALFLAPVYLAQRLLAPGAHWKKVLLAGLASIVVFAALSPYALLNFSAFRAGAGNQVGHHYASATSWMPTYFPMLAFYTRTWPDALGGAAALLALAGLALTWRRWRTWLPLYLFPLLTLLVIATAYRRFGRHLLPSLPVIALLAAVAVAELRRRSKRAALLVALALPIIPLSTSLSTVVALTRPGTRDQALDWITAHAAPGARILTTLPDLGLGRGRFEVLRAETFGGREGMVAREFDMLVTTPDDPRSNVAAFPVMFLVEPDHPIAGPTIEIRSVPPRLRRIYRKLAPDEFTLAASDDPEQLPMVSDGRLDTAWQTSRPRAPRMWVEVRLSRPALLGGVEIFGGTEASGRGRRIGLLTKDPQGFWQPLNAFDGRPWFPDQYPGRARTQRLLFPPVGVSALRIVQTGQARRPWRIAELHVLALAGRKAARTVSD